ncbi:MAG: FAD/NAD(P)-binding oxidoreductase [Acidiferrobacteraceae bacterium]|jgi:sulfide dehydrogenase [flavocytochrome c] flavoprotein subunit
MNKFSRRSFFKLSGITAAAAATTPLAACASGSDIPHAAGITGKAADLPKAKGPRVVVVGGGWSGLTMAKYLKKEHPDFDVVLIEKRGLFMSCPITNLWLADQVKLEFLDHSFLDAAKNNNYIFFNATVIDVDRKSRKVYTEQGYLKYEYLVLAPGIDYNYSAIGVTDPVDVNTLKTNYPAGFMPGSEHLSIKNKLAEFEGGVFVLTVPQGNYRCLPAPYERTCMVAAEFKKQKIKGKVLLLDGNPDITIKKDGFHHAFDELYKGIVEYQPGAIIKSVDVAGKTIKTEFDSYKFDDGAIYPRVRASRLIETLGLVKPDSPQFEANIDPFKYNVIGDEHVYVTGDARPMGFSKSGNTSNSEAHYVAKVIAAHAQGKEIPWESPHTVCFSAVMIDPLESISVDAHYKYNEKEKHFGFYDVKMVQNWSADRGQANLEWARGMYRDMFS